MKLKEILKDYYAVNSFPPIQLALQAQLNIKLKADMVVWGKSDDAIFALNSICLKAIKEFHPDSVIAVAKQLYSDDWEVLYPALQGMSKINLEGLYDLIIPQLILPEMNSLSSAGLKAICIEHCLLEPHISWYWADSKYQVLPEECFDYYQEQKLAYTYKYISEKRDCDDAVRINRGWLSMLGLGNLTVGAIEYNAYSKENKILFAHAVEIVITEKKGQFIVRLAEPQKNKWWSANGTPSGMFWDNKVDHIKIRKITF